MFLTVVFEFPYCVLRIAYCVLRIAYCVLRIAYCVLRIAYSIFRIKRTTHDHQLSLHPEAVLMALLSTDLLFSVRY